jgi:hypothetical protein
LVLIHIAEFHEENKNEIIKVHRSLPLSSTALLYHYIREVPLLFRGKMQWKCDGRNALAGGVATRS